MRVVSKYEVMVDYERVLILFATSSEEMCFISAFLIAFVCIGTQLNFDEGIHINCRMYRI